MATDAGIERLVVPESPGGEGWDDFVQLTEVRNACRRVDGGHQRDTSPEFLLGGWHEAGQTEPETVVARRDGTVVSFAEYHREEPEVAPVGWFELFVLPEHRRRGIGARLYDEIERLAADDGRTTLIADFSSPPREGPVVAASNGAGGVPADDPGARFALARGYALG
ncbi:GNAT family N-acetyltransferase [Gryllotalpicola protaetiae]|uniref:GNAT family N-acetyltransferase n=1 Tax=Gryllotalpicola protaetiae TaxID=2419771 RepID=UPI0013C4BCB4|nr:GNAT family N-acetyltransferase [Gryllotalpicola protaetiae]